LDYLDLENIYEELEKTVSSPHLPGAQGGGWDERDPLILELKSRTWHRRRDAVQSPEAKLHHILMGIKDKDFRVAMAAAKSPLLNGDALRVVMRHPHERVRRQALTNPNLPPEFADEAIAGLLPTPESARDLENILTNPSLSHEQLMAIHARLPELRGTGGYTPFDSANSRIVAHPNFDPNALNQMALAALEASDPNALDELSQSPHLNQDTISAMIARGPLRDEYGNVHTDFLSHLLNHDKFNGDHILDLLNSPSVPSGIKSDAIGKTDKLDHRHLMWYFNPPNADEGAERQGLSYYQTRNMMDKNDAWTPEVVDAALKNPHVDINYKTTILDKHANAQQLAEAIGSPEERIRKTAFDTIMDTDQPERIPQELKALTLSRAVRGEDPALVHAGLSYDYNVAPEDADIAARRDPIQFPIHSTLGLKHKNLPVETIRWAAASPRSEHRSAIANRTHPIPPDVLSGLLRDPQEEIRTSAANWHRARLSEQDILHILTSDLFTPHTQARVFDQSHEDRTAQHTPATWVAGLTHPNPVIAEAAVMEDNIHPNAVSRVLDDPNTPQNIRLKLYMNHGVSLRPSDVDNFIEQGIKTENSSFLQRAAEHPSTTIDQLKRIAEYSKEQGHNWLSKIARNRITDLDPDVGYEPVQVRYSTAKLRKIRDSILATGAEDVAPNKLKDKNGNKINLPGGVDWNQMRLPNGNISAKKLQSHIDALPSFRFNTSHHDRGWMGMQRHSNEKQKVFQLNITSEMVKKLKDAGLWDYWQKVSKPYLTAHPVNKHTVGWVRYTGEPATGLFMDEVQSDFANSPHSKAVSQIKRQLRDEEQPNETDGQRVIREEAKIKEVLNRININYGPEQQHHDMLRVIFGDKHPHEALHEAFAQHLRDKGHAGTKIAIHTGKSKAGLSGWNVDEPLPVHAKIAYEDHPKKMGMEPSTYSSENMPTMNATGDGNYTMNQGAPLWQDELHKYEKLKEAIKKLVLAKMEEYAD
jgi:hypothetical protein